MGFYRSLKVFFDSNGSSWVLIGPYLSLRILLGPYGLYMFLFVFRDFNGSLWVVMRSYVFFRVFIGPYAFFWVLTGSYPSL